MLTSSSFTINQTFNIWYPEPLIYLILCSVCFIVLFLLPLLDKKGTYSDFIRKIRRHPTRVIMGWTLLIFSVSPFWLLYAISSRVKTYLNNK